MCSKVSESWNSCHERCWEMRFQQQQWDPGWKNHVNISTDTHCVLGIRQVPRECNHTDRFSCTGLQMSLLCVRWFGNRLFSLMSCWAAQRKQLFYQWDYYTRQVQILRTHGLSDCLFVCLSSFHFPPLHLFQYFSFAVSLTKIVLSSVSIEIKRMLKY